jgi:glutamate/tyrosine decarboxylase-like PLP-dependent enzyme
LFDRNKVWVLGWFGFRTRFLAIWAGFVRGRRVSDDLLGIGIVKILSEFAHSAHQKSVALTSIGVRDVVLTPIVLTSDVV